MRERERERERKKQKVPVWNIQNKRRKLNIEKEFFSVAKEQV